MSKAHNTKGMTGVVPYREDPTTRMFSMITPEECKRIAYADAPAVSTTTDLYVEENYLSYYVLINTWMLQVSEGGERGCFDLLEAITTLGLLRVIRECASTADIIISYDGATDIPAIPDYLVGVVSQAQNTAQVLQWLRYPKRFSPARADLIAENTLAAFQAVNRRCKMYTRDGYPQYWVSRIRDRISDILDGYDPDWTLGFFSTGVAADAARPLSSKLFAYAGIEPRLYHDSLYPIGCSLLTAMDENFYTAQVRAVPKSYKSARIIAMEHAYRQFHMQAIRLEFERLLKVNGYESLLDLHDQTPNQTLARQGAIDGSYATIDLSSASDSLSRDLVYSVFPQAVVRDLDAFLPKYFSVPGKRNRFLMHMFCTSGSAVTFPVESIVFLAIMLEIREAALGFAPDQYHLPQVFGDDLVIDAKLYDTAVEVLTQLGFVVNEEKSFAYGSSYRESCGVEFLSGYDTQSTYWPRATIQWTPRGIARAIGSMCALQHQLYGSYRAQKFLVTVVRSLDSRMTSHLPGTACVDLWEPVPRFREAYAPGSLGGSEPGSLRELHLTLRTRRSNMTHLAAESGFSGERVVEMWRFARFLRLGPMFDCELDRLLGVSSKPTSVASDCDTGEVYWGFVKE